MKRIAFLAFITMIAITSLNASLNCGEQAPAFTLPAADGSKVSLESFRGKFVVLEWFNHNCPFVNKFYSCGAMQKWQAEETARGVIWLVIDSTNPSHQDYIPPETAGTVFAEMKFAATALLLDDSGTTGRLYGATNTPQIFIINPAGILIYQGAVDDKRTTSTDDVADAHNYLLAALDNALSGKAVKEATTHPYGCSVKYGDSGHDKSPAAK
jgi:peroxiredoxin